MGSSMIENLPTEIMARILEHSLLHERLILARCSTQLLHLITKECTELWVRIDLMPLKEWRTQVELEKRNANLTDEMLATLLTRVNAREITRFLSLQSCKRIVGPGLESLRDSRFLEHITLPSGYRGKERLEDFNEHLVIDILHTMIPHSLCKVNFTR